MKNISIFFVLILLLSACSNSDLIHISPTPNLTTIPTIQPTSTPPHIITPKPTDTFTATPIPNGLIAFYNLESQIQSGEVSCEKIIWEDVNIEVVSGTVQPFAVRRLHSQPESEPLCEGFFVIPTEPGNGLFVYHDQVEGITVLEVTYDENDLVLLIYEPFQNTTPTPSQ